MPRSRADAVTVSWNDNPDAPPPGTVLCRLEDIADEDGKELTFGDSKCPFRIFVVRRGDEAWGYVNTCPHQHIPLNYFPDRFTSIDRRFIMCANHAALFNFDDGYCVSGPCAGQSLEAVPVVVRDGVVSIA